VEPEQEDSDSTSASDSSSSDGESDEVMEEDANGPLAETGVRERPLSPSMLVNVGARSSTSIPPVNHIIPSIGSVVSDFDDGLFSPAAN